ncbi:cell growth regulator with RING finger domain protein 1-like [Acropora millepora]|uniref:cell growth regulator with RING finger domain protein 1-like n=1 Tax=Acropora millepora TaxID=45264 RepID=UPI001CF28A0C|nr:cell growth regulator with RING finger domain protein 1-like [Acropora millepora]
MVDWMSLLSVLVVTGCFLLLGRFIIRLGVMEREAIFNLSPPRMEIPSRPMIEVKNPFDLKLKSAKLTTCGKGIIDFVLSTTTTCFVTFYWEVGKDAVDAILRDGGDRQLRSNFDVSENNSSDSDSEEMVMMSAVPLERVLRGSYSVRSFSELYDCGSDHEVIAESPSDLKHGSQGNSSLCSKDNIFTLVVTTEMVDSLESQQPSDIVALLTAVQVSQSLSGILISSTERQFVQTADGNFYSLKKLFVVESDDLGDVDSSTQHSQTSSTLVGSSAASLENKTVSASPSELVHAVCIVCRTLPVTRAFLPCRHACVCGLCFQQLSCCPMCRGVIQSYFKIQDEPFADTAESDASSELKRMTAGEILRGIFLPS